MKDQLTDEEIAALVRLGKAIMLCLECDANETGLPCRTDRLEAVHLMKQYVLIHTMGINPKPVN